MRLSDAQRMYDADNTAIHVAGIPSLYLMENAAGHLARAATETMGENPSAVIFCGAGNNGGDGIAAGAILLGQGVSVRVCLVGKREKLTPDSRAMLSRLETAGGALEDFDPADETILPMLKQAGVIVDALFGIGLKRPLTGTALAAVEIINASGTPVVAADIPSGVSADTGAVLAAAVQCVRTVTFSMAKPGHYLEPGCLYAGKVEPCPIGIPAEMLEEAFCGVEAILPEEITLPRRPRLSHKGSFGRVLILGGSVGYTGAPNLAAAAAVRAGAGLVSLAVPESIWQICAGKNTEAMPFPLPADEEGRFAESAWEALEKRDPARDVLAMGPGMGRGQGVKELVQRLLTRWDCPMVLDADALWAISDDPAILKEAKAPVVITPHPGEFRRLGGEKTGDRLSDARAFAAEYGCITVLKGHRTVIAFPEGAAYILCAGNPGMARGGSGDVLTGILAAMIGQLPLERAVLTGCALHAMAGDACAEEKGEYGMTPTDMIETLPYIMKGITK